MRAACFLIFKQNLYCFDDKSLKLFPSVFFLLFELIFPFLYRRTTKRTRMMRRKRTMKMMTEIDVQNLGYDILFMREAIIYSDCAY